MSDFKPIDVEFITNSERVARDMSKVKKDITSTTGSAEKAVNRVNQSLERQATDWRGTGAAAKKAKADLDQVANSAASAKPKFNGLSNSVNQITREFPNFAVSAQTGILSLSNNIPILADQINNLKVQNKQLVASGQKGVPIWRSLTKVLFGWQTVLSIGITLLTVYGREIGNFVSELFKGKKALDVVKESQEALNEAFESTDYTNAVKEIQDLKVSLDLAKEGILDNDVVVNQYNESIGKATTEVTDLKGVEQGLIDNADNYVQAMLFKAAANLALENSAKELAENTVKMIELEEDLTDAQETAQRVMNNPNATDNAINASRQRVADVLNNINQLNKSSEESEQKTNEIFARLKRQAATLLPGIFDSGGSGGSGGSGSASGQAAIRARQALLDRIADIDREFARKRLESDEQELDALREKFDRIRDQIEKFNKQNPTLALSTDDLVAIEDKAVQDLLATQQERRAEAALKAEAARQKQAEKERQIEQEKFDNLLTDLMSFEERRLAIEADYDQKSQLLEERLSGDDLQKKLAALQREKDEELNLLQAEAFKQSELFRSMNKGILSMTRQQIEEQVKLLKEGLEGGFFTTADGTVMQMTAEQTEQLRKAIATIEEALQEADPNIAKMEGMAEAFRKIQMAARDMAFALQDISPSLSASFETIGDLTVVAESAVTSVTSFMTGDIIGGITSGISAIAGVFSIAAKSRESARKAREELRKINDEAEDGERRLNALQRERNLAKAKELELTLKSLEAQRQALQISQRQIQGESAALFEQLQNEQFIARSRTEKIGGFLGIGRKTRVVNEFDSLAGKTFEEIEKLFERGKLEGRAKALFEELRKLKNEGQDVQQQLDELERQTQEILTGTTASSIADGIIDGLRNGKTAVEDFAGDMERLLQNAILNAIKYQVLEAPLQELMKKFAEFAESDGQLTEEEAAEIRRAYEDNVKKAVEAYEQFSQIIDDDLLQGDGQQRGLSGAIRRELTEETGSELTGLFRGQFDITKRHLQLDEEWFRREAQHQTQLMAVTAQIEVNTRVTSVHLAEALVELKAIKTNTKPPQGGRDQGRGG